MKGKGLIVRSEVMEAGSRLSNLWKNSKDLKLVQDCVDLKDCKLVVESVCDNVPELYKEGKKDDVRGLLSSVEYRVGLLKIVSEGASNSLILNIDSLGVGEARRGVSLRHTIKKLGKKFVIAILGKVLKMLMDDKMKDSEKMMVVLMVIRDFVWMTLEEVVKVLMKGLGGEFGVIYRYDLQNVSGWFREYSGLIGDMAKEEHDLRKGNNMGQVVSREGLIRFNSDDYLMKIAREKNEKERKRVESYGGGKEKVDFREVEKMVEDLGILKNDEDE